jgi:uncharacterized protein with PQ loop repeat
MFHYSFIHFHKRKKKNQINENAPNKAAKFLDKIIYAVAFLGPLFTVPQIIQIYVTGSSEGLSLLAWSAYLFLACFWLTYGLVHKEKIIIFANTLWILTYIIVVIEIIVFS